MLLTKLLKWKKPQASSSKYEQNMKKDINEYNAWQQLRIFQNTLSEDGQELVDENKDEPRGNKTKTFKVRRQQQVDILDHDLNQKAVDSATKKEKNK